MIEEIKQLLQSNGKYVSTRCNEKFIINSNKQQLLDYIMNNSPDDAGSMRERLYCIEHSISIRPTCKTCNGPVKFVRDPDWKYRSYCSIKCSSGEAASIRNTSSWSNKSPEEISISNDKRKASLLAKTGYEYNSQRPDIKQKIANQRKIELDDSYIVDQYTNHNKTSVELGREFGVYYGTILERLRVHDVTITHHVNTSSEETELCKFLDDIGIQYVRSSRTIISPYELDIYIPSKKVAIEYNGLPWHCEEFGGKDRNYHLNKTKMCHELGIRLIHIFSHKWNNRRDQILTNLKYTLLGAETKYNARDCDVIFLDRDVGKKFIEDIHIDGDFPSTHYVGLVKDDIVLSVISLSKHRFKKSDEWEIVRFCSLGGVSVRGGLSKMLTNFRRMISDGLPISTYVDRSLSDGESYIKSGFSLIGYTSPGYHYYKNNTVYSRMNFQKHKLESKLTKFNPSLSEIENMKNNGYDRFWDCGNSILTFNK